MNSGVTVSPDGATVTIHVPMSLRKRGGRKVVVAPEESVWTPIRPRVDNTLIKALARAFRWRGLLEDGSYASVGEIAAAEKINASYVSRVLRLTLLAPDIVAAILDGRQRAATQLSSYLKSIPPVWAEQKAEFEQT